METYFIPIQDTNFQLLNIKMGDGERREKMLKMWKNCRFSYLSTGERFFSSAAVAKAIILVLEG